MKKTWLTSLGLIAFLALTACSGSGSSSDTDKSFEFNGKSPQDFFAQFYVEVTQCEDPNRSKFLRKGAVIDAFINSIVPMDNGLYLSVDVLLSNSRFKLVIDILEKQQMGYTTKSTDVVEGDARLVEGKVELKGQGQLLGRLTNGFALNGEDTMELVLLDSVKNLLNTNLYEDLKPAINQKMVVKNVRELLSTQEGNVGCTQGAEALVFQ